MNYGFKKDQVKDPIVPFPVSASVDNVILDDVQYVSGSDKRGQSFEAIDFFYKRELPDGTVQRVKDRMFCIDEGNITPSPNQKIEEAIKAAYTSFNSRLLHIVSAFGVTREEIEERCGSAGNFRELATAYAEMLKERAEGITVWLKTLPDKGFVRVANFPNFIQAMSDGECTLSYTTWEKGKINSNTPPPNGVHEEDEPKDWSTVDPSQF